MYAFEDQYGWAVAPYTNAPMEVRMRSWNAPRTFRTKAEAERWIREALA